MPGFLTGLHTHHHGAYKTDGSLFQPGETIATALQRAGYHTIQVGKYMNLFERVYPKWPPGWDEFHGFGGAYYGYTLWSDGVPRRYGHRPRDYSTDVIATRTVRALDHVPRGQPLFAWVTPYAMHKPWTIAPRHRQAKGCDLPRWKPPGYMERDVTDKPAYIQAMRIRSRGGYQLKRICRGLLSVDQLVGRVVRKLKHLHRLENTMLILTSDNGMPYGAQRVLHDKKVPYGTQIPFYVHWPRVLGTKARTVGDRIQNIDLAPTLCDIAGCELGPYPTGQVEPDGRSFLRLLTGERDSLAAARGPDELPGARRAGADLLERDVDRVLTARCASAAHSVARVAAAGCTPSTRQARPSSTTSATGPATTGSAGCEAIRACSGTRSGLPRYAGIEQALRRELARLRAG